MARKIAGLLLVAALIVFSRYAAHGQTWTGEFRLNPNPSTTISVGKTYVTIKHDGTVEYGEGYTPDAAAKAFWDAVGVERKARNCKAAEQQP